MSRRGLTMAAAGNVTERPPHRGTAGCGPVRAIGRDARRGAATDAGVTGSWQLVPVHA